MCALWGKDYQEPTHEKAITELSDVIFYMDFSGIFDRDSGKRMNRLRQEKARELFRPEGISLDFGSGPHRYLAFERSGNMSRQARLSFLRADVHDAVRHHLLLDMTIGDCQLSKLYAYMGLMLSSGVRIEHIELDKPHRVVVIDNPLRTIRNVNVITVTDDGVEGSPSSTPS